MRKTTLIVLLMTMSLTANCVLAQAKKTLAKRTTTKTKPVAETGPTKEETIAWLKEKLIKYFDYGPYTDKYCFDIDQNNFAKDILIQLNECELTIATIHDTESTRTELSCPSKSFIPTTNIIIGDDGKISCKIDGIHAITIYHSDNYIGKRFYKDISFTKKSVWPSNPIGYLINGEVDLYKKMQKAFDHLATFCPKKKELF